MFWNKKKDKLPPMVYDSEKEHGRFELIDDIYYGNKYKLVKIGGFNFSFCASYYRKCSNRVGLSISLIDINLIPYDLGYYEMSTNLDNFKAYENINRMRDLDELIHEAKNTVYFSDILSPSLNKVNNEKIEKLEELARELVKMQEAFDTHREELFEKRLLVKD